MQTSFSSLEFAFKKKVTRREQFLAKIEAITPWARLVAQIDSFYPKGKGPGRPPIGLERMLRMYIVQQCLGLSDEGIEDALYDSQAIRGFVGIDLGREASAVSAKGAFWFATYEGQLSGELFVDLRKKLMHKRKAPVHLVVDNLPAHKTAQVKHYVASTQGALTLHFLPGYAPDLNPDELVWSHTKRTGVARNPLKKGEKPKDSVDQQLQDIANNPDLVRSFFKHPSVAYISDR